MMESKKNHLRAHRRRGVTLLELLVVVTLMGTLSTVVVTRYGRNIFGDIGVRTEAHRLWLDLQRAQSRAVRSGTLASIVFVELSPGKVSGYRLIEQSPLGIQQAVSDITSFTSEIQVTTTSPVIDFTFEGHARKACTVTLNGPNRTWVVNVVPLSGSVNISET